LAGEAGAALDKLSLATRRRQLTAIAAKAWREKVRRGGKVWFSWQWVRRLWRIGGYRKLR
jgi:hypothetical protein